MQQVEFKEPSGNVVVYEFPDEATEDQIKSKLRSIYKGGLNPDSSEKSAPPTAPQSKSVFKSHYKGDGNVGDFMEAWGKSSLESLSNIPKSAFNLLNEIKDLVNAPIKTAKNLNNLAAGVVASVIPGRQGNEVYAEALVNHMADEYGGLDQIYNKLEQDPLGVISNGVGFVKGGLAIASKASKGSTLAGQVQKGKSIEDASKKLSNVDPLAVPVKVATLTAKKSSEYAGKASDWLLRSGLGLTKAQVKKIMQPNMLGADPIEFIKKHNITGNLAQKAEKLQMVAKQSTAALNEKLSRLRYKGSFESESANVILDKIIRLMDIKSIPDSKKADLFNLKYLRGKKQKDLVEMQHVKRIVDQKLKLYKNNGTAKDGEIAENLRIHRGQIQKLIEKEAAKRGVPEVAELNKNTQIGYEMSRAIREGMIEGSKPILHMTDYIILSPAYQNMLSGISMVAGRKFISSPTVRNHIADSLSKLRPQNLSRLKKDFIEGTFSPKSRIILQEVFSQANRDLGRAAFEAALIQKQALESSKSRNQE